MHCWSRTGDDRLGILHDNMGRDSWTRYKDIRLQLLCRRHDNTSMHQRPVALRLNLLRQWLLLRHF